METQPLLFNASWRHCLSALSAADGDISRSVPALFLWYNRCINSISGGYDDSSFS